MSSCESRCNRRRASQRSWEIAVGEEMCFGTIQMVTGECFMHSSHRQWIPDHRHQSNNTCHQKLLSNQYSVALSHCGRKVLGIPHKGSIRMRSSRNHGRESPATVTRSCRSCWILAKYFDFVVSRFSDVSPERRRSWI